MPRVLVIDDDQVFAKLISLFLLQRGHDVVIAPDGQDGLDSFKSKPFDVVVCDIVMPNREGIETIRELRRLNEDIAIVAISGGLSPVQTANVDVLELAEMMGADVSLKKPFPLSALAAGIERALADHGSAKHSVAS